MERKSRLRRVAPVDYDEREKKKPICDRPKTAKTECAIAKERISALIDEMSMLNKAICIHNRLKDKISIDDVDAIQELLDDSDDDDDGTVEIEDISSKYPSTSAFQNFRVDKEFSLQYAFSTDVSSL